MYEMPRKGHETNRKGTRLVPSVVKEERQLSLKYHLEVKADTGEMEK